MLCQLPSIGPHNYLDFLQIGNAISGVNHEGKIEVIIQIVLLLIDLKGVSGKENMKSPPRLLLQQSKCQQNTVSYQLHVNVGIGSYAR